MVCMSPRLLADRGKGERVLFYSSDFLTIKKPLGLLFVIRYVEDAQCSHSKNNRIFLHSIISEYLPYDAQDI